MHIFASFQRYKIQFLVSYWISEACSSSWTPCMANGVRMILSKILRKGPSLSFNLSSLHIFRTKSAISLKSGQRVWSSCRSISTFLNLIWSSSFPLSVSTWNKITHVQVPDGSLLLCVNNMSNFWSTTARVRDGLPLQLVLSLPFVIALSRWCQHG